MQLVFIQRNAVTVIPETFKKVPVLDIPPRLEAVQKYSPSCIFFTASNVSSPLPLEDWASGGSRPPGPPCHWSTGAGKPEAEQRNWAESPSRTLKLAGLTKTWGLVTKKDGKWLVSYYVKRNNLTKFYDAWLPPTLSCTVTMSSLKAFLPVHVYVPPWIDWVNLIVSTPFSLSAPSGRAPYMPRVHFSW